MIEDEIGDLKKAVGTVWAGCDGVGGVGGSGEGGRSGGVSDRSGGMGDGGCDIEGGVDDWEYVCALPKCLDLNFTPEVLH
uniref:Uncharacterized protein n=1 Tax=Tanacetum cinerariifolium TaxID=118510 RepID=A0A6L2JNN9_TANCI|nr:hypothetical protein [Tanacetum cinerariifolium]